MQPEAVDSVIPICTLPTIFVLFKTLLSSKVSVPSFIWLITLPGKIYYHVILNQALKKIIIRPSPLESESKIIRSVIIYVFLGFFLNVYSFLRERERERERASRGRAEREGEKETEDPKQGPCVSTEPDVGLKLLNHEIMTWAEFRRITEPHRLPRSLIGTFKRPSLLLS